MKKIFLALAVFLTGCSSNYVITDNYNLYDVNELDQTISWDQEPYLVYIQAYAEIDALLGYCEFTVVEKEKLNDYKHNIEGFFKTYPFGEGSEFSKIEDFYLISDKLSDIYQSRYVSERCKEESFNLRQ